LHANANCSAATFATRNRAAQPSVACASALAPGAIHFVLPKIEASALPPGSCPGPAGRRKRYLPCHRDAFAAHRCTKDTPPPRGECPRHSVRNPLATTKRAGITWIRIDADAETVDGISTFEDKEPNHEPSLYPSGSR
jgi:hypothetical protein